MDEPFNKLASPSYSCGKFDNLESIGVLCRGSSLKMLEQASKEFDHCFLVGQFDVALSRIGKFVLGKKIVQLINKSTIQTNKYTCDKYDIKDIQCNFDGWLDREMSDGRKDLLNKIKHKNKWAVVHPAPPGIRERRGDKIDWVTTGIFCIDLACFLQPKQITIIGLDFYESDYFVQEKVHVPLKKNKDRRKEMLKMFRLITERDSDIQFNVYTHSKTLKTTNNIKAISS